MTDHDLHVREHANLLDDGYDTFRLRIRSKWYQRLVDWILCRSPQYITFKDIEDHFRAHMGMLNREVK